MSKSKMFHFNDISIVDGNMRCDISLDRFSKQFQQAQEWLDKQVARGMEPFMPVGETGHLKQKTSTANTLAVGTGMIYAAKGGSTGANYGRFQYMGKVMVDPVTKSPWARKDAIKVVTGKSLTYSQPDARPFWFDEAKKVHGKEWVAGVKKIAGGK